MKIENINIKRISMLVLGCSLLLFVLQGCVDSDQVGENFYTFTGNTVGSYLEKDSANFSEFWKAVKIVKLNDLLKSYNQYTCFAPTNAAMESYYEENGVTSANQLSDSLLRYVVYTHLIPNKVYLSTDFSAGSLSFTNMNSRFLVVGFKSNATTLDIIINTNSLILNKDIKVENGVIHSVNRVITPSTLGIPKLMEEDPRVGIFTEALVATGLEDSLQLTRDMSYVPEIDPISIYGEIICRSPKLRKFGYTVFAESNDVLSTNGISNLYDLKQYAAQVYKDIYPDDVDVTNPKDRRNSLNRFVAYHIIDKMVSYSNFFYTCNMVDGIPLSEFMETLCPNTIFKVSNETNGVIINNDSERGVQGVNVLAVEAGHVQDTENGYYYLIDKPLVYNQAVKSLLLNTRIRMDAASLQPELMTNGIRYEKGNNPDGVTGDKNYYKFPKGYLKNVAVLSSDTRIFYLQGNSTWCNYQADEMMVTGKFDFIMRVPPVPAGTYEVRFGYTANPYRGILQFYVDDDNGDLQPRGIPLNMKHEGTDPAIGWIPDLATLDDGVEVDKMMRNRGYMKGGISYKNVNGGVTTIARAKSGAIRRIVCTETWTKDRPHYLRFKSVSSNALDQFHLDYLELVPKNVYNRTDGKSEDRY